MSEELNEKVARLEVTVMEHSKQLEKQQEKNDLQVEMNTLLRMQIEANEKQNLQMEKFGNTLDRVDKNLTNLNANQSLLDERVSGIENTLQESNINPMGVVKGSIKYVATGIGGIIIAYLLYKFGLN